MTFLSAIIEAVKTGHTKSKVQAKISSARKQMSKIILLSLSFYFNHWAQIFFFKYQSVPIVFAFIEEQCSHLENYGHMFQD